MHDDWNSISSRLAWATTARQFVKRTAPILERTFSLLIFHLTFAIWKPIVVEYIKPDSLLNEYSSDGRMYTVTDKIEWPINGNRYELSLVKVVLLLRAWVLYIIYIFMVHRLLSEWLKLIIYIGVELRYT